MRKAIDKYSLHATVNKACGGECEVKLPLATEAGLMDYMAGIMEAYTEASSFVFTVVRRTEYVEEHENVERQAS